MFDQFLSERGVDRIPGTHTPPWVVAHRGYSGAAPENTLAAVDAARALGVDYIEVDANLSADGTPVVIHDQTLNRTTSLQGAVANLSDEEISLADAGSWMGPGFAGQRVSSLRVLLDDLADHGGNLFLELKQNWSPGAIAHVSDLLIEAGMAERTIVHSFSVSTLESCRDMMPMVPRCLLRMVPKEDDIALVRRLEAIALNPSIRGFHLRRDLVSKVLASNIGVYVWTADEPGDWAALLSAKVSGIITNHPGRLQGYLAAKYGSA